MEPKISVIVPVYKVEKFLSRCLDSIVGQRLTDIEIICVNDGSPDRSIDILNEYAARDSRVQVISQENRGLGGARNRGFDAVVGRYVLFVDSDDWIDPDFCQRLYEAAERCGADVACASMLKIRPSYAKWTIHYTEALICDDVQAKFDAAHCPPDFYVMNKLMRRDLLLKLGVRFRERVVYEDVDYTMRVLAESGRMVTVPDTVYRYMVNGGSITKSHQTPQKQLDKYLAHKAFIAYADAHGIRLDGKFRNVTRRYYKYAGISWLKIKDDGRWQTLRLFDCIPVYWKKLK